MLRLLRAPVAARAARRAYSVDTLASYLFKQMDANKDGVCTLSEMEAFLLDHPDMGQKVKDIMVKASRKGTSAARAKPKNNMRFAATAAASVGKSPAGFEAGTVIRNEDAYFASERGNTVGVADGVGGWRRMGVDASEYPTKLTAAARDALSEDGFVSNLVSPAHLMQFAFDKTHVVGSCAVVMAAVRGVRLEVANVGDCACLVLRRGAVVFATDAMSHGPGKPYQLALQGADVPGDAEVAAYTLRLGDVVVCCTDGLLNNIPAAALPAYFKAFGAPQPQRGPGAAAALQAAVGGLVAAARERSQTPEGHNDDITCVVGLVGV
eukprot:TRINITY_DN16287_c0_g1_i1.p2 TRINITY_DN16287_c0_g1~~TRINITY_DN16287_c0_g1_i1.p2  ORF type:complete len:323 (+),score=115.49 TRINITY_DN16287_c0_g1_i1:112-1080(+)